MGVFLVTFMTEKRDGVPSSKRRRFVETRVGKKLEKTYSAGGEW